MYAQAVKFCSFLFELSGTCLAADFLLKMFANVSECTLFFNSLFLCIWLWDTCNIGVKIIEAESGKALRQPLPILCTLRSSSAIEFRREAISVHEIFCTLYELFLFLNALLFWFSGIIIKKFSPRPAWHRTRTIFFSSYLGKHTWQNICIIYVFLYIYFFLYFCIYMFFFSHLFFFFLESIF